MNVRPPLVRPSELNSFSASGSSLRGGASKVSMPTVRLGIVVDDDAVGELLAGLDRRVGEIEVDSLTIELTRDAVDNVQKTVATAPI